MFFTQEDYRKIQDWLSRNSSKDSELLEATPLNGNEIISIVQANHNKKISIKDFVNQIFKVGSPDFFNVTDKLEAPYITLEEAISMLPTKAKKQGQVITFLNKEGNWDVYQFIGANNQCNIPDKWNNIFDIDKYIIDSLLPDEEDLTKTKPDAKGNSYVSLKDRAYNPSQFSGYGEKILRKHIIEVEVPGLGIVEKNILYQDVFDSPNTVYKIRYDFDLNGQTIELPENCILDFVGGSIDNGTLVLNDTLVYPFGCVEKEVIKCEIEGAYKAGQMFFNREQGYFLIWDGENWKTKVAYRVIDNKLNESLDGGVTWTPVSDYIAAYFRWSPHNTIQISRNNRDWDDLSEPLADNVYIKGYYNSVSQLPSDALIGDIYMVGTGAPYDMYINTSEGWKNNGPFTSVTAGIEQTTGQSTTNVMSQKAVTDKFTELESETLGGSIYFISPSLDYAPRLIELYLTGLQDDEDYQLHEFKSYQDGVRMQVYIRNSSGAAVALYDGIYKRGLVELREYESSGVSGYAVVALNKGDSDLFQKNVYLQKSVVSNIDYSPSIKSYLSEQGINENINENVQRIESETNTKITELEFKSQYFNDSKKGTTYLKELYLTGLNTSENYRLSRLTSYSNGERMQVYVVDAAGNNVAVYDGYYRKGLVALEERNSSGIRGYAIVDLPSDSLAAPDAYLRVDIVGNIDYSPSIKSSINDLLIRNKLESDITQLESKESPFIQISDALNANEKSLIKVVKSISLIGDWESDVKYCVRILQRTQSNAFRIAIVKQGSFTDYIYEKTITIDNITSPYVELLFPTYNGRKVTCVVDTRVLTEGASLNFYDRQYLIIDSNNIYIPTDITQLESNVAELESSIQALTYDFAAGTYEDSCMSSNSSDFYVKQNNVKDYIPEQNISDDVVAIGHDDLPVADYIATRKIYNKFGFKGTFNYILSPFETIAIKDSMVENVKKMLRDGHHIGFHAIFGTSFFWRNPLVDIRPNGTCTFAPTLEELKGANGTNVFGKEITETTTFSGIGFGSLPLAYNVPILSASEQDWLNVMSCYSIFGRTSKYGIYYGLDLDDKYVGKSIIGWLEYWHNNLISDIGYSSDADDIETRFATDYVGTYPSVEEILSGEFTSNGHFVSGLFTGCKTCCNYEVIDRIISIAEAVVRHYFGLKKFDNMAYHGSGYFNVFWSDDEGNLFNNRDKTILATGHTPMYISNWNRKANLFDIVRAHGIHNIKRIYPVDPNRVEGMIGLYRGQADIRGCDFNDVDEYTLSDYFALLGESESATGMQEFTYEQYKSVFAADTLKGNIRTAYEMAGQKVGDYYILQYFKKALDAINAARGTGKIPFLGVDTIKRSASIVGAIEMLCKYCYDTGIRIVSTEEARQIANRARLTTCNMFPNPSFRRSLLDYFDGWSTKEEAYYPDGWYKQLYSSATIGINVNTQDERRVMTLTTDKATTFRTRIYGLAAGTYRFKIRLKSDTAYDAVKVYLRKNSEKVDDNLSNIVYTGASGQDYVELTSTFIITEPFKDKGNSILSQRCDGYENNVNSVIVELVLQPNNTLHVTSPSIERVDVA